jgi:hypothetical protein
VSLLTVTFPTQSFSSEGLFFNVSSSRKLLTELKYADVIKQRFTVCQQQYSSISSLNASNERLVVGLTKDKVDLTVVAGEFEKRLLETNKLLIAEKESKPSRLVWYGLGAITAVVLGLVGAFLITK